MSLAQAIQDEQAKITAASEQLDNAANHMAVALLTRIHLLARYRRQQLKAALRCVDGRNGDLK